jgi:hypothetical protein
MKRVGLNFKCEKEGKRRKLRGLSPQREYGWTTLE